MEGRHNVSLHVSDSGSGRRAWQVGGLLRHVPAALLVVVTGLIVTVAQYPTVLRSLRIGPSLPGLVIPTGRQWANGAISSPLRAVVLHNGPSVCADRSAV